MAIATNIIRYGTTLTILIAATACAAGAQPKKQTTSTIRIDGKNISIRCAPKPSKGIEGALAEKINNERERIYGALERTTAELINEEVARQGIPLGAIANESWNLADMSDGYAEQIYLLGDELAEITTKLVRMSADATRNTNLLHTIITRITARKLAARKTRIESKMADLISVRIELESGIEKNKENTDEIRTMIATTFKTPRMTELEKLLAANAAEATKAEAFCAEQAAQKRTTKKS